MLILDRGDTPVAVSIERFDRLPEVTLPAPGVDSAAGRVWAAIRARGAGAFKARWSDAAADSAAVDAALISLGTRRAAAVDLVTLGLAPRPELGLSRFETAWYQARGVAFPPGGVATGREDGAPTAGGDGPGGDGPRGDGDRARRLVRLLQELPSGGYPDRVRLLMPWLAELCADPRLRGAAAELVAPFVNASEDAQALAAALMASPDLQILETLGAYVRVTGTGAEAAVAAAIVGGGRVPDDAPRGPALAELDRHATALAHCLAGPGAAGDDELRLVGFVAERARRAYLAGTTNDLDEDHEAVRHYRALAAYLAGEPIDAGDLRPAARPVIAQLDGQVGGAEVAADPSAWPRLWPAAVEGRLVPDSDRPAFGHWVDLGAAHRLLRDADWARAAADADRIAAESDLAPLRAEALNLAAYAWWQLGHADDALRRLDEALAVHPVEGVAVNAALVADGPAVLPYLARVMGLTLSPTVRAGALNRAIDLWTAGMCGSGYPAALAAMVRGGLAVPQADDDLHRTLLTLSFRNDRAWLASASVVTTGPLQERTARYVQRRAAYETRPSKVSLRAVTVALIGVWRLHPRPAWASAELGWLTDVFERLLDAPFDPATNPVPAVETLLGTEVLDLAPSLILGVRAGAHLAREAERRGRSLPAETERKLVLTPVRTFRLRRDELDEQDRKAVSAALAAGLEAATGAIVNVTVTRNQQLVRRWRQLEMEPVQDYADGRRVVAQRMYVLDRFDGHVRRCRAYLKAMDGLPVNEGFVRHVRDAIDGWTGISSRVRRSGAV